MIENKEKITDPICQAIEIIGRQLMSEMSFDITETATIVDNSKKDQGQYTVRSSTGNAEYIAYSTDTNLSNNATVYVTIPKGDYNEQKLIVSKKTSETEKPIIVKNSLDDLVSLVETQDFVEETEQLNMPYGLLANGDIISTVIFDPPKAEFLLNLLKDYEQNQNFNKFKEGVEKYKKFLEEQQNKKDIKQLYDKLVELLNSLKPKPIEIVKDFEVRYIQELTNFIQNAYKKPLNLAGYTRFGVKAGFRSLIPEAVEGNYGLVVHLYSQFESETDSEIELEDIVTINNKKYIDNYVYLDTAKMYGNPYNFNGYFSQDYVVDISELKTIDYIKIEFRQESNFKDKDGKIIPVKTNENGTPPPDLLVNNIQLFMGYDKSEVGDEYIHLYSLEGEKYTGNTTDIREDNKKQAKLRWVHNNEIINSLISIEEDITEQLNSFTYGTYGTDTLDCFLILFKNSQIIDQGKKFQIGNKEYTEDSIFKLTLNIENSITTYYLQWHQNLYGNSVDEPVLYFLDIFGNFPTSNAPLDKSHVNKLEKIKSESKLNTKIEWFRYKMGAASATAYSGVEWEKLNNDNQFSLDFYPDVNLQSEKLKVIITETIGENKNHYRSNILEFTNSQDVSGINAGKYMSALTIRCDDNSYGNYFIYDQGYGLLDQSQSKEIKTITAHFDLDKTGDEIDSPLLEADSISWTVPASNTMINVVDNGIEGMTYKSLTETRGQYTETNNGYRTEYSSNDENKIVVVKIDQTKTGEEKWYDAQNNLFRTLIINSDGSAVGKEIIGNCIKIINFSKYGYKDNKLDASQPKYTIYNKKGETDYDVLKPLRIYDKINNLITICNYKEEIKENEETEEKEDDITINNKLEYRINGTYSPSYNNNTIQCKIMKDGVNYTTSKELSFGIAGTADTDYTLVLDFDDNQHALILLRDSETNDWEQQNKLTATVRLYGPDKKIIDIDTTNHPITWGFYSGNNNELSFNVIDEYHTINDVRIELRAGTSISSESIIIIQASINWAERELTAYLPIPITNNSDWDYIKGSTRLTYLSDGSINYNKQPYQIINKDGNGVNISSAEIIASSFDLVKMIDEEKSNKKNFYFKKENDQYISGAIWKVTRNSDNEVLSFDSLYAFTEGEYDRISWQQAQGEKDANRIYYEKIITISRTEPDGTQAIVYQEKYKPSKDGNWYIAETNNYLVKKYEENKYYIINSNLEYELSVSDFKSTLTYYFQTDFAFIPEIETQNNQYLLKPLSFYVEDIAKCGVRLKSGNFFWTNPILILQNTYPSSGINDWDGKELKLDSDNSSIYSSFIAAGKKNSQGQFSGVVLGEAKEPIEKSMKQTGLYGFHNGAMSYAFKEDGTGFIGKSGSGRIEFNGESGTIYSSNEKMIIDLDDGIIKIKDSRGYETVNLNGLDGSVTITGEINATSGTFSDVDIKTATIGPFALSKNGFIYSNNKTGTELDKMEINSTKIIFTDYNAGAGIYFQGINIGTNKPQEYISITGASGLKITGSHGAKLIVEGISAKNQEGIYARFA